MARDVAIVPHTHWDREWYAPYQTFRMRLVELLDEFLPRLEADPSYTRFLLDGQMAAVDDYLEVRPEAEAGLRRLAVEGRVAMGPWYTLMDEFLVSGETIVRDLQLGFERAAAFGGAMDVGYLPDMFGHIAQMPQLLHLAGLEHAVVWRGVPSAIDRSAFRWEAPDGSSVRAEYLVDGYGNGEGIPEDPAALVARLRAYVGRFATFLGDDGPILFMNGTDHQVPQPWLGRVVAAVNAEQDEFRFCITSLAEYLADAPDDGLPEWCGELRSGARANLLMGVASNRVDVKQAAARAERQLERLAEPLCALYLDAGAWPEPLLRAAWLEVIRNAAHDSICACSVDDVCIAVLHRYAEARAVGEGLTARALRAAARSLAQTGWMVVNPSARERSGVVEVEVPGEGDLEGTQAVRVQSPVLADRTMSGEEAATMLGAITSQQLGEGTYVNSVEVVDEPDRMEIVVDANARLTTNLVMEEVKAGIRDRIDARPGVPVRLLIRQPASRRVLARMARVPGFGWASWQPAPLDVDEVTARDDGTMANGLVTVSVDAGDGTFAVDGVTGLGRLVDGGDRGDTYNYSPPADDVFVDVPERVEVRVVERGPLRARVEIDRTYTWPERIRKRARTGAEEVTVSTTIELRAGERLVRVETSFDNRCRDHRLRAHFPLPRRTTFSEAECAFAVVRRGLEAEGGPSELGLPTFPSRRFVRAGGLTLLHEGLLEYELVDGGAELALTLLRATGMLSRVDLDYRPLPAGPPIPMEGPQMAGRHTVRYAVHVGDGDPYALADDAFLPLLATDAPGGGTRPASGSTFAVEGAEVSALRRSAGGLEVRVFNPTPAETAVRLPGCAGWLVDLRGRPLEPFDGGFPLRPWGIATARLTSS